MPRAVKARMPTSATGTDRHRGFTLIELVVVLALGAMVLLVLSPRLEALLDAVRYRSVVQDTLRTLERARMQAVVQGQRSVVAVDVAQRQFLMAGQPVLTLPEAVELDVTGVADLAQRQPSLFFEPDGSASGGRLTLSTGGRVSHIELDWLTGQITHSRAAP